MQDKFYKLIKPAPNYYASWATACHGLSFADTSSAPDFGDVWCEVAYKIEGLPLVAHNKSFDELCLRQCCSYYEIPYPNYEFHCTLHASRRRFPNLPNHQLHTVSAYVGYVLDNHHHALADAEACAAIALQIL